MPLTPAHDAALRAPAAILFVALEVLLPSGPLRLLDGAGAATFGGRAFTGRDATLGALASLELDGDGMGDEAPELTIGMLPPTNTAAAALSNPAVQGAQVTVWQGVIDGLTGLVVPDPDVLFVGEVDVPELAVGEGTRAVSLRCVSVFEKLFEVEEGARLNDAFHQSIWPGEKGFEYVTDVERHLPWGQDAPRPAAVTSAGVGGATGGGGGSDFIGVRLLAG